MNVKHVHCTLRQFLGIISSFCCSRILRVFESTHIQPERGWHEVETLFRFSPMSLAYILMKQKPLNGNIKGYYVFFSAQHEQKRDGARERVGESLNVCTISTFRTTIKYDGKVLFAAADMNP